jgi:hypothetical protein
MGEIKERHKQRNLSHSTSLYGKCVSAKGSVSGHTQIQTSISRHTKYRIAVKFRVFCVRASTGLRKS